MVFSSLFSDSVLLGALVVVGVSLIAGLLARAVLYILSRVTRRLPSSLSLFFYHVRWAGGAIVASIVLMALLTASVLPGAYASWVTRSERVLFILSLAWFFVRLVALLQELTYRRFALDDGDNLRARKVRTQFGYIKALLNITIVVVALAFSLRQFDALKGLGTGLLASAGVAGIIIGFAAQRTLGNLLAGLQIAFTQPMRLDDVVVVEGEWGRIEEITLTYVVVHVWDQRRLVLPITYFVEHPFQNWTRKSSEIWGTVNLYVDYSVPVDEVRRELDRVLKKTDLWDGEVSGIQVTDSTDKVMVLRVLLSAKDAPTAWDLRCLVRERLISFLQRKYPSSLPRMRVEASDGVKPASRKRS